MLQRLRTAGATLTTLLYGAQCQTTSIGRGVFISPTWGRYAGLGNDAVTECEGHGFGAARNP